MSVARYGGNIPLYTPRAVAMFATVVSCCVDRHTICNSLCCIFSQLSRGRVSFDLVDHLSLSSCHPLHSPPSYLFTFLLVRANKLKQHLPAASLLFSAEEDMTLRLYVDSSVSFSQSSGSSHFGKPSPLRF